MKVDQRTWGVDSNLYKQTPTCVCVEVCCASAWGEQSAETHRPPISQQDELHDQDLIWYPRDLFKMIHA